MKEMQALTDGTMTLYLCGAREHVELMRPKEVPGLDTYACKAPMDLTTFCEAEGDWIKLYAEVEV